MAGGPRIQVLGFAPPPGSYLCFESSKSGSSKRNKVIRLADITDIQKVGAPLFSLQFRDEDGRGGAGWQGLLGRWTRFQGGQVPPGDSRAWLWPPNQDSPSRRPCHPRLLWASGWCPPAAWVGQCGEVGSAVRVWAPLTTVQSDPRP